MKIKLSNSYLRKEYTKDGVHRNDRNRKALEAMLKGNGNPSSQRFVEYTLSIPTRSFGLVRYFPFPK